MEAAEKSIIIDEKLPTDTSALRKLDTYWADLEKMPVPDTLPPVNLKEFPEDHRIAMFNLAKEAWDEIYDQHSLVEELRSNDHPDEQYKKLKKIRKYASLLRGSYVMLDSRQMAPQKHWKFTKLLGQLNDRYETSFDGDARESLCTFIENEYSTSEGLDFFPATNQQFAENYNNKLSQVKTLTELPEVTAREHHEIRKLLRNYMNLFRLSGTITGDEDMGTRGRYLQALNDELGDKRNDLVPKLIQGEIDYKSTLVEIPFDTQRRIGKFIAAN